MNIIKKVFLGIIFVAVVSGGFSAAPASADHNDTHTIDQLTKLIAQLQAQIVALTQHLPPTPPTQGACPVLTYNLYLGHSDSQTEGQVTALQKHLAQYSDVYPDALITGYFGPLTEQAVQRFQRKHNIVSSGSPETTGYGVVGPATRAKIRELCGKEPIPPIPPADPDASRRDSRRVADIKQLQLALELYWDANKSYPVSLYKLMPNYIVAVPEDPLGNMYPYLSFPNGCEGSTINACRGYHMGSSLEIATNNALRYDSDYDSTAFPGGINGSDQESCRPIGGGITRYCYDVKEGIPESGNLPPTISGVSGPTALNVGQSGTWTVNARDPENGTLTYSAIWGDESYTGGLTPIPSGGQMASFTHTYTRQGVFNPTFTVTDSGGLSERTSLSVNVGGVADRTLSASLSGQNPIKHTLVAGTVNNTIVVLDMQATEPMVISRIAFRIDTHPDIDGIGYSDAVRNLTLYNGTTIVAGPKDLVNNEVVFTDTFIVPTGLSTWTLRGDVSMNAKAIALRIATNPAEWMVKSQATSETILALPRSFITFPAVGIVTQGSFNVSLDPSTPSARTVAAGSTDVPVTILRVSAYNEDIRLTSLGLLADGVGVRPIARLSIWDGVTKVWEKAAPLIPPSPMTATLDQSVLIPAYSSKTLTIKVDIAKLSPEGAAQVGDTISINYDGYNWQNTKGVGQLSGNQIYSDTRTTTAAPKITVGTVTTPSITVLSPNGGEMFTQGSSNKISWTGGKDVVQVGLVKESATNNTNPGGDSYLIIGWINTNALPNSSMYWDAKAVYDLSGNFFQNVIPGRYKIIAVTKNSSGEFILWDGSTNKPGVWDISDAPFNIVSGTPVYQRLSIPSNILENGDLTLYRFSATAPSSGNITVPSFDVNLSNSGVQVSDLRLYVYSDSNFTVQAYSSNPVGSQIGAFTDGSRTVNIPVNNLPLPAGIPRYFDLKGSTVVNQSSASVTTSLQGLASQTLSGGLTVRPDLAVVDIYDDAGKLSVKISNIGNASAPSNIGHLYIWIDDQLVWTYSLGTLANQSYLTPGGITIVQPQTLSGSHKIKAYIDPNNVITESNESNNVLEKTLSFGSTVPTIAVLSPNGGEVFIRGAKNRIAWTGGNRAAHVGLVNSTYNPIDPSSYILGWITLTGLPIGSIEWDAKTVCGLTGSPCWDVTALSSGPFKVIAQSEDDMGNFCSYRNDGVCNVDLSNAPFTIVSASDTTPPIISAIYATPDTPNSENINWSTNEVADTQVDYGITMSYGQSYTSAPLLTLHPVHLINLSPGTLYHYRVKSKDAAGNMGVSNDYTFTTLTASDTTPPTIPANFNFTVYNTTGHAMSWSASTDNVGVTGYRLERCTGSTCTNFAQIAMPTTTSYTDLGLAAGTTYRYRVRAHDAAGNISAYSAIISRTTDPAQPPPDTTVPSTPTGLFEDGANYGAGILLAWNPSTDNVGVVRYRIERCTGSTCTNFVQIGTWASNNYNDTEIVGGVVYRYRVRAEDAAGNLSGYSNIINVTAFSYPDTTAPSAPTNLFSQTSISSVNLSWTASTDNVGVVRYNIYRCREVSGVTGCTDFPQVGQTTSTFYTDSNLLSGSVYRYRVRAMDAAGNLSASGTISVTISLVPPSSSTASILSSIQEQLNQIAATLQSLK